MILGNRAWKKYFIFLVLKYETEGFKGVKGLSRALDIFHILVIFWTPFKTDRVL